jgi:hypothetical protein
MNSLFSATRVTAPLDDPFYYLANFRFVLDWVAERHDDLLSEPERAFIACFDALPRSSQALLVRMVMRKGEHFRTGRLVYDEIGDSSSALAPLVEAGLVEADPLLTLDNLFRQLRLPELRRALADEIAAAGLPGSLGKAGLFEALASRLIEPRHLADWWPELSSGQGDERVVRLGVMETCDRVRLMFFGNLHQDWAEFVLAELGLQRFERVAFTAGSRAFQERREVDAYLALHRLRERLEEGESPEVLQALMPVVPAGNAWLAGRCSRLCHRLGLEAERGGQHKLALWLYARGGWKEAGLGEARIRHLRLLERLGEHERAHGLAEEASLNPLGEKEAQALDRLLPRLRRRLGLASPTRKAEPVTERWELRLDPPGPESRVELAARDHLGSPAAPVHYVENILLTGLFGLLCWRALFAPLPGAFFHPFHNGPADLYREDFVARRRELFTACLGELDDGRYQETIRATWRDKAGIASPFVHWGLLDESLLDQALAAIPACHLRICFDRLIEDLKANRAGLPDLIQFRPNAGEGEPRYRLIEVKGPGDRLQDNQRRWLAFFHAHAIPAVVCHVSWRE